MKFDGKEVDSKNFKYDHLEHCSKYSGRMHFHQHNSYSTWLSFPIENPLLFFTIPHSTEIFPEFSWLPFTQPNSIPLTQIFQCQLNKIYETLLQSHSQHRQISSRVTGKYGKFPEIYYGENIPQNTYKK